jgi:hypothetical protein
MKAKNHPEDSAVIVASSFTPWNAEYFSWRILFQHFLHVISRPKKTLMKRIIEGRLSSPDRDAREQEIKNNNKEKERERKVMHRKRRVN